MIKWLTQVDPNDRAVDVAARSLESRLHAVHWHLRRAVKKPDKPEYVHQLRVWSRRADAALDLYADLLPTRALRQMRRMLKRLRRAAGRIRDVDVFAAREAKLNGMGSDNLKKERQRAQRKLVTHYDKLDGGRKFKRRSSKIVKGLQSRNANSTELFVDRAQESLRPMLGVFFSAFPSATSTDQGLHRFRIAGKDVRYAMELLTGAFRPAFRDEIYPMLEALQEKLGQINDIVAARKRLRKQFDRCTNPAEQSELYRRLTAANDELTRERDVFHRSWTPESRESLRRRFEEILQ